MRVVAANNLSASFDYGISFLAATHYLRALTSIIELLFGLVEAVFVAVRSKELGITT